MIVYTKVQLIAKDLKKQIKAYGVNVLRCSQSKKGALITIENTTSNQKLFIQFCKKEGIMISPGMPPVERNSSYDHIDYGTMFKFEEVKQEIKEHYPEQKALFMDCDWTEYLTVEYIESLVDAKTNQGRYMGFVFDPQIVSHGFNKFHKAYSRDYISMCLILRGRGSEQIVWDLIKKAHSPSPLGKLEMSSKTQYGLKSIIL